MEEQRLTDEGRAVLDAWLKAGSGSALSPEQLADWLAGRADAATAEAVERAMAADAELRAALLAVRAGEQYPATAEELARALAIFPAAPRLVSMPQLRWLRPMAAAAVVVLATGLGWMLGLAVGAHFLHAVAASAADLFGSSTAL